MFKIKRKLIALVCFAALLLSGCGSKENTSVNVFSTSTESPQSSYFGSAAASSSTAADSSSPISSSSSAAVSSVPVNSFSSESTVSQATTSSSSISPPVSTESSAYEISSVTPPPEPPVSDNKTIVYTHDPKNACTITFDDSTVIVRGKKNGNTLADVRSSYPSMSVNKYEEGDEIVFEMTSQFSSFTQIYGVFDLFDANGYKTYIHLDLMGGTIKFPDVSSLVQNNDRVVNSASNASAGKTITYITRDGKRDKVQKVLDEIKALSDEICEGIDSDYEKLRAIANWTSANIYYDRPAYNKGIPQECLSLEYMLDNKTSVCGGYSNMTSALCAAQGIRCLNITGNGLINGNTFIYGGMEGNFHEWNVAEIDGRLIIVDAGWDSHNDFRTDMQYYDKKISYGYFDIGAEVFAVDHKAKTAEYRDYWALLED